MPRFQRGMDGFAIYGFKGDGPLKKQWRWCAASERKKPRRWCGVHSQCLTGDVLTSLRCDCRAQLELSMKKIGRASSGILLYLPQEGRGIGLMNNCGLRIARRRHGHGGSQ